MTAKIEITALLFGISLILVTFGDAYLNPSIGNLDTIFGLALWPVLDVIYPLASIAVFLMYGWFKGGRLRLNASAIFLFFSFVVVLLLINIDDMLQVLKVAVKPPATYWHIIMWIYPSTQSLHFTTSDKNRKVKKPTILFIPKNCFSQTTNR